MRITAWRLSGGMVKQAPQIREEATSVSHLRPICCQLGVFRSALFNTQPVEHANDLPEVPPIAPVPQQPIRRLLGTPLTLRLSVHNLVAHPSQVRVVRLVRLSSAPWWRHASFSRPSLKSLRMPASTSFRFFPHRMREVFSTSRYFDSSPCFGNGSRARTCRKRWRCLPIFTFA